MLSKGAAYSAIRLFVREMITL